MASYQIRQRDPLLDQGVQAMLERRARELLGLVLIVVSAVFAVMLMTYSPDDPGWMVATSAPVNNALGRVGAAAADTLITIAGLGAWGIPAVILAWGMRFATHQGADRAMSRVVFAVIAVAFGAIYCATLVPGADWTHSFGLGGLFGDTILGSLINIAPGSAATGLKLVSLLAAVAFIAMLLFVTGFDMPELVQIGKFLMTGLVVAYSACVTLLGQIATGSLTLLGKGASGSLTLLGKGATGSRAAAIAWNENRLERRAVAAAAPTPAARRRDSFIAAAPMTEAETPPAPRSLRPAPLQADTRHQQSPYSNPLAEAPQYAAPREKLSLLARLPQLMRREVEPEHEL
ncbi:MAG: DNA translocase FtsK 4TM domain-containing protein, partial [Candidatus Saccharibacteria bacterium]|nr:DNA translocase FtsK 4TM domain-containing protein [Pseudorhodobacter sp.]